MSFLLRLAALVVASIIFVAACFTAREIGQEHGDGVRITLFSAMAAFVIVLLIEAALKELFHPVAVVLVWSMLFYLFWNEGVAESDS